MKRMILVLVLIAGGWAACAPSQKQIEAQHDKDPQYQYKKAEVCMQYGFPDEALKYLNQALALDPRYYQAYNLAGQAYMKKENYSEAIKAFESCLSIAPNSYLEARINIGYALMSYRKLPEAIKAFQDCIALVPKMSELYNYMGIAFQELDKRDEAEAAFKKGYDIDQNYNASYNLAKLYFLQNKFDLALENVRISIQKYDRSLLAWNLQGLILDSQRKYDDAAACYLRALKIIPDEPTVSFNLAETYYRSGQIARAKDLLEKTRVALEKTPPGTVPKNDDVRTRIQDLLKKIAEKK
jgi:tetratricopeptide (TPR) repeat protein